MDLDVALDALGFADSPNYVASRRLRHGDPRSHIFRKAISSCSLKGVYFVGKKETKKTPIVFVSEASSLGEAERIHQHVWNQNVVPLLLVNTPDELRLYHAFQSPGDGPERGVIAVARTVEDLTQKLRVAHAASIDSGAIWTHAQLAKRQRPVDSTLLEHLDRLVATLASKGVGAPTAYALIGKLLFLRYLRDRDILSDRRLNEFGLDEPTTLGPKVDPSKLQRLIDATEAWLDGRVFPLTLGSIPEEQIQLAVRTLHGDDPASNQLGLGFSLFQFDFIPVETLSSVYQRLLHSADTGRSSGAYYTPRFILEFLLDELQEAAPLRLDTSILDPACGSGAFLVHAFRRLVELFLQQHVTVSPAKLREILCRQIFGIDKDGDACRIAQLSLTLTMLDYIEPPDLFSTTFKLPVLYGSNIICSDFFDEEVAAQPRFARKFDWIVGNPPWVEINAESTRAESEPALRWITANSATRPVASNQLAEAFLWKSVEHLSKKGVVGLVLPSISLFKDNPRFLRALARTYSIQSIANLSSFAKVAFEKAATAASTIVLKATPPKPEHQTLVFSPLIVNQPGKSTPRSLHTRPLSITLNRSEIRSIPSAEICTAPPARWKALVFAGVRDAALVQRLDEQFLTLQDWLDSKQLIIMEGPQLRHKSTTEETIPAPQLVGKPELVTEKLRGTGRWYAIPEEATRPIDATRAFLRVRGGLQPLDICRPPHVIVSASLKFSAFSDNYLVIPPRQIGIAGKDSDALRVVSLFLSSTFVRYHQFFAAPQGGIRGGRTTLASLRHIPCPLNRLSAEAWQYWLNVQQSRLAARHWEAVDSEVDRLVYSAFGFDEREEALIEDFVFVTMPLTYGDVSNGAVREPSDAELESYAKMLKRQLDSFLVGFNERHSVTVIKAGETYGVVDIAICDKRKARVSVSAMPDLPHLSAYEDQVDSQWLYLDRNLLVVEEDRRYLFKPLQVLWWTRAQAVADADRIAAEAVTASGEHGTLRGSAHITHPQ